MLWCHSAFQSGSSASVPFSAALCLSRVVDLDCQLEMLVYIGDACLQYCESVLLGEHQDFCSTNRIFRQSRSIRPYLYRLRRLSSSLRGASSQLDMYASIRPNLSRYTFPRSMVLRMLSVLLGPVAAS